MLKGRASTFYYNYLIKKGYNFNRIIYKLRCYFKKKKQAAVYIKVESDYLFKDYYYKFNYFLA